MKITVEFDPHALTRMRERDILEEEVRETVEEPTSLKRGRKENRYEATKVYSERQITVVYDKIEKSKIYVITVY